MTRLVIAASAHALRLGATVLALLLVTTLPPAAAQSEAERAETVWYSTDADGAVRLQVHFFWALG